MFTYIIRSSGLRHIIREISNDIDLHLKLAVVDIIKLNNLTVTL